MQSTTLTRSAVDSSRNTSRNDDNGVGADAAPAGEEKGYVHLLHNLTLKAILAQPYAVFERPCVQSFLVDGVVPCDQNDLDYLALWTVRNAQGGVLNALLGFRPLVIPMNDESSANGLLAAMQTGLSFSGLTLQLDTTLRKDVLDAVIPLLTQAFSANTSLAALVLFSSGYRARGLQPLFDVLAGVKHLQLITVEERLHAGDVTVIATLLSKNKTMCALELNNLGAEQAGDGGTGGVSAEMTDLFQHLGRQSLLERLVLSGVPAHCESLLGNFLGSSNSLATLRIRMDSIVATEPLVAGFRKNTSIEKMYLDLTEMADGLLPLLAALADSDSKGSLTHVTLTTCQGGTDAKDSQYIGDLVARNNSLASLVWVFTDDKGVDLARLGTALEKNRRLESLSLIRMIDPEERRGPVGLPCDWVDASMIPTFLESLNKNRTLTALVFSDSAPFFNAVPERFSMLQQVLDRNRAWQVFACSDAYISGAVQGFFASLGMPVDTHPVTADCLLHHTPRVAAGALALVNKATYYSALAERRDAHPAMLNQRLEALPDYEESREDRVDDFMQRYTADIAERDEASVEGMIALLNGIIASTEDYSADDLRRIANGPSLGAALVVIMGRSAPNYLYLARRFCQVVGTEVMRSKVLSRFANPLHVSERQLMMLEHSFEPDQQHLSRFVERDLDYRLIDSNATRLFVGYNVRTKFTLPPVMAFIKSWCVKNRQPGVLMALHDSGGNSHFQVKTREFPVDFRRCIIKKIPSLQNVSSLGITGRLKLEDAMNLQHVLATEFGLTELDIRGCRRGPDFDLVMNGLKRNKGIKTVTIARIDTAFGMTMCGTLAEVLRVNGTIRTLRLGVHARDPELADFERLSQADARLVLEIDDAGNVASSSYKKSQY